MMLGRRWVRVALLVGVTFVWLPVGVAINATRTCTSPRFGLPTYCDDGWVILVAALLLAGGLGAEAVVATRRRMNSRPCPQCGHRVANGQLVCSRCEFDFAAP